MDHVTGPARVIDSDDLHCQLTYKNLFLTYTVGPASDANIRSLVANFDAFGRQHDHVGFLLATRASTRPPESAHRRMVQDVMNRHAKRLRCVAMCIEASGFAGSVLRSVAAAIFILPNPGYPVKFFSAPGDAAPWVATSIGVPTREVEAVVGQALESVRPPDA